MLSKNFNCQKIALVLLSLFVLSMTACDGGGGGTPPVTTGNLQITVIDSTTADEVEPTIIENARVIIFDADTGESVITVETDVDGLALVENLELGNVNVRVSALGFESSPARADVTPIPFEIVADTTYELTIALTPLDPLTVDTLATVSGTALDTNLDPIVGALAFCEIAGEKYFASTDGNGVFVFYNVPGGTAELPNTAEVKILVGGYEFDSISDIDVISGEEADVGSAEATRVATGSITGTVNSVATGDVPLPETGFDVTLLIPETGTTIPGLKAYTVNGSYTINGVPDGTYEILASRDNDLFVTDPHDIVRDGIPLVSLSDGVVTSDATILNFEVTPAVDIANDETFETGTLPKFTFEDASSFSSADWFVIEVIDESGNHIIEGFSDVISGTSGEKIIKNKVDRNDIETIGAEGTYYEWTFDASIASAELVEGGRYQFRLYAIKITGNNPELEFEEYNFESASEDLKGVFTMVAPEVVQ